MTPNRAYKRAYREAYGVIDELDALGPEPAEPLQRGAWELAQLALLDHEHNLDLERGLAI